MKTTVYGYTGVYPRRFKYVGTAYEELKAGEVVHFNQDASTQVDREFVVETPSYANEHYPAGVLTKSYTVPASGEILVEVQPFEMAALPGVEVYTDGNIVTGDVLGAFPGSRTVRHYCGFGAPLAKAIQTVDRSSTDGSAVTVFGSAAVQGDHLVNKVSKYDNKVQDFKASTTVNITNFLATHTATGTPVYTVNGDNEISITTGTANNDVSNLSYTGEMFPLSKAGCFRARGLEINDADTADWFVGLAVKDTDILGGATDSLGFRVPAGDSAQAITYVLEKDSTETSASTGTSIADNTGVDLEIFYADGAIAIYVNGTAITAPAVTNFPNDENLTIVLELRNASSAASTMLIGRLIAAAHL